ncbi:MAG: hypothetical protein A2848_00970 [Candidatus Magasanikbacteria bacterium RIFCSPHIGHO2_01_FULL_50_8]|uniref:Uncharacterized protein n=2 Tax=Candidatus Magasanikiibacteriota TaxID=1752731 RepID=A0A1F6LUH5_9BACT|nr:MAG: hypothetical protein A2848_00970 [Candidatus Magasanikbacteria bacterium RIFCSPHIGHO2_01_FULL_50_8]OGH68195.1 MAG: hypothetical protein A3C15_01080 [Candidatus Magasanikbacteria bacterium RIFCSPHIGHO2_02_FULL_50_9b]
MGFFSSLFGGGAQSAATAAAAAPLALSPAEEVKRQIETTEGELHEAHDQLEHATDPGIKSSLEALVSRKTQALTDLQEKLQHLQ